MNTGALPMMGLWFAAGATGFTAVALVLRDLLAPAQNSSDDAGVKPKLTVKTRYTSTMDKRLARLLDLSGSGLSLTWGSVVLLFSALIGAAAGLVATDNLLVSAFAMFVGATLPLLFWNWKLARRLSAMRAELPAALEVIAESARVGRGLMESAEAAALETKGPLAEELRQAARQLRFGALPHQAVESLMERVPLPEFRVFATAVLVHETTGGNLSLLTRRLAAAAHERQAFLDHLSAVSAGSRFSAIGLTIGALTGAVALVYIRPEYMQALVTHEYGPAVLAASAGLFLLGAAWVWKVLRIEF